MSEVRILSDGLVLPEIVGIPALERWIRAGAPPPLPGSAPELPEGCIPQKHLRRITRLSAMAVCAGSEALQRAGLDDEQAPLVWATANGEINTIGMIMDDLLGARGKVSPSQFHNSVYNAATGYWGIITGRRFPSTTVSRGELSFEYGLLEAWARLQTGTKDVLLVAGDEKVEVPQWADPAHCTIDLCGALLLSTREDRPALARIADIRHARPQDRTDAEAQVRAWADELGAVDVQSRPNALQSYRNPCSGLMALLTFVHHPPVSGTVLFTKTDRDGDLLGIAVEKL